MYNQKPLLGTLPNYAHPLTPNVAAWLFNEGSGLKAFDLTGNENHGTLGGGTASPTWKPGRNGPALDYDAANDYVIVADSDNLDIVDAITIVVGMNTNILNDHYHRIVHKDGAYDLSIDSSGSKLSTYNYTTAHGSDSNSVLSTLTWLDIILVKDSINGVVFYINGAEQGTDSVADAKVNYPVNANPLYIGLDEDLSSYCFDGPISEVFIYSRALNAQESWQLHVNPYCWLAQPVGAELMYAAPPVGVMSSYYYESLMAGAVI